MNFQFQITDGLKECRDLSHLNLTDGYTMVPAVHSSWKTAKRRLLVVAETIDSLDIRNGKLLSGDLVDKQSKKAKYSNHNPMRTIFSKLLDKSVSMLKPYDIDVSGKYAFGICNFNAMKIRHMRPEEQRKHFSTFTNRVLKVIDRLKPTHVLVCGDTAAHHLLKSLGSSEDTPKHMQGESAAANSNYKRGWVFKREWKGHEFRLCPTLDIEPLYNTKLETVSDEDDFDYSENDKHAAGDLLFMVARHTCNMLAGKMLHDLSHIKPNPVYIDTIEKFDGMMEKLWGADTIAMDTETANLSSTQNKLVFSQFAISEKRGYVVPVDHPKTPFDKEECRYIKRQYRKLLLSKKAKTIIFFNGSFDLRIYRTQAKMPIIPYHRVHEITAGDHLLDENIGLLSSRIKFYFNGKYEKTPMGGLRALFTSYGNDLYWRMPFSKEERNMTSSYEPDDPDVLNYCALDVTSIFGMAAEQHKRAHNFYVKPSLSEPYTRYSKWFATHLLYQMSAQVQDLSYMEQYGTHVDVAYLEHMLTPKSPLLLVVKETTEEMLKMPSVQKANKILLKRSGKTSTSLFGSKINMNMFSLSKPEHKATLFFDVLKLAVVSYTKTGKPALDAEFLKTYKGSVPEAALQETVTKASKLQSTYVKGWYKKLMNSMDSVIDHCLRPGYGFFTIVTGRLNSFKPSLQQIPSRGKLAYYIKRMFTPKKGRLSLKDDYSAHEIRMWAIIALDKALAQSFKDGLKLRRALIKNPNEQTRTELKKKGDLHIINVHRFFGKWVDKADDLRDAIKQIIFGLIYGKSVRSLSRDIKKPVEEAQRITDKLYKEFPDGAKWLNDSMELIEKHGHMVSLIGRVRNMWRVYTGKNGVIAAAQRRGKNSPIQGFASEVGAAGVFLTLLTCYEWLKENDYDVKEMWPHYSRAVHDSALFDVPYAFVLPFMHIRQYMATFGLTKWYKEKFNVQFIVDPEIEMEVFASEDASHKWDWEIPNLLTNIYKALQDQVKLGQLKAKHLDSTWEEIIAPWKSKKTRRALQEEFPILNVPDLDDNIVAALKNFKVPDRTPPKEEKKK